MRFNNKTVAIWGTGEAGLYLFERIRDRIVCMIDNKSYRNSKLDVAVVNQSDFINEYYKNTDLVLVTAQSSKSVYEILNFLDDYNTPNIAILKPKVYKYKKRVVLDTDSEETVIWYRINNEKCPVIPRLEVNLIDGCNLNCKACSHFSSLYSKDSIYPLEQYIHDVSKITSFYKICRIRLLGGEPLLIKNLDEYIRETRKICKEADIEIVTNRLLIDRVPTKLFDEIKLVDGNFTISLYPPTAKKWDQIEKVLDRYEIDHIEEGKEVSSFVRNLTMNHSHDGLKASGVCLSSGCLFLRNGKLYKCPLAGTIDRFVEKYEIQNKFPVSDISVDDETLFDSESVRNLSVDPSELCSYCSEKLEFIAWKSEPDPTMRDWLYCDGKE